MTLPPAPDFPALIAAAASVVRESDLTDVLTKTVETAMQLTGARYGALGVIGQHGTLIEFLHRGMDPQTAAKVGPLPTGKGVLGTLMKADGAVRLDHISGHPESTGFPAHHPEMDSFLGVPIQMGNRVFGNLYLTDKPGGFTEEDEQIVESLSLVAGSAVSTARLHARLRRVAVVEDRERIARDLHDAIIQDLFAVGLSLQGLALRVTEPDVQGALDDAVHRLDEAIASLRRFIFGLRPPVWTDRNLVTEVADLLGQLAAPYSAKVELIAGKLETVPGSIVENCIHMIREATSNALRHSGASTILVTIDRIDDEILATISDDGIGFDLDSAQRGLGLDNLEMRATDLAGSVAIRTRPGAGTAVTIRIPTED